MAKKVKEEVKQKTCDYCSQENELDSVYCSKCYHYLPDLETIKVNIDAINSIDETGLYNIKKFSEYEKYTIKVPPISTGSLIIDKAFLGGFPRGNRIEIAGPDQCGKTTLALHTAAEVQKLGGQVLYIDVENAVDIDYAERIGVDIDNLYLVQPNNGTHALKILTDCVGLFDLIILDSVGACAPNDSLNKEQKVDKSSGEYIENQEMASLPRMMGRFQPRVLKAIASSNKNCTIIFINQVRENVSMFASQYNKWLPPGGRAYKHLLQTRILMESEDTAKSLLFEDEGKTAVVGRVVKVRIVKSKNLRVKANSEIQIKYDGIYKFHEIKTLGYEYDIIKKSGAWWICEAPGFEFKIQGDDGFEEYLEANPKTLEFIENEIKNCINSSKKEVTEISTEEENV